MIVKDDYQSHDQENERLFSKAILQRELFLWYESDVFVYHRSTDVGHRA